MKLGSRGALALVLNDSLAGMSEDDIVESVAAQLDTLSEAHRRSFERALQTIGQTTQGALPGVKQGAAMGSAGGPGGAALGGAVGGLLSLAGGATQKRQQTHVSTRTAVPPPAVPPTPPLNQYAAQLLTLCGDPKAKQAIAAAALRSRGRREILVDQTRVPSPAVLNLIAMLAQQAAQEAEQDETEIHDSYLRGPDGEYVCDVVNPVERARVLMEHFESEWAAPGRQEHTRTPEEWLLDAGLAELVDPFNTGAS